MTTTSTSPTVAQAFVAQLLAAGVRRVYGVPGEDHLVLLHAIETGGLRYVSARDESAAGMMATAEAQRTGIPGVVLVTPAPGITNAINGIASAALDHVPLLVVVGQHAPERRPVIIRQNLDNHALVAPLVKWSTTISTRIHQTIAKALEVTIAGPAGPVLLELRDDVARAPASDVAADWPLRGPVGPVIPATGQVAAIAAVAVSTARPVIIVGGRARSGAVGEAVSALAAAWRAPTFVTPSAKGALPAADPWLAGTFLNGNLEDAILGRADVILGVGLDASDVFNGAWRHRMPMLAIQPDGTDPHGFFPFRSVVEGDPATLVRELDEAIAALGTRSTWEVDAARTYRSELAARFDDGRDVLTIPSAISVARAVLPDDAIVTIDAGFGKPLMSLLWDARSPVSYVSSQGLSTMGYAIPAANAIKLAEPDRTVVGFMGDGSLLMRASEIGVAVQQGIAPIYLVWLDGALSQIEVKQRRQDLRPVGVSFVPPSCPAVAAAFGATGVDVDSRAGLDDALRTALTAAGPTLIGVRVDHERRAEWFESLRG